MPRRMGIFCALMILLLPIGGCSPKESAAKLQRVTDFYMSAASITSRVAVSIDLTDRVQDYTLDWTYDGAASVVTVIAPDPIAGITISTVDNGVTFTYGDTILIVDPAGGAISPLEALPIMFSGWAGGLYTEYGADTYQGNPALAVTYTGTYKGSAITHRVWFDSERLTPLYSELYSGGFRVVQCEYLLFSAG